jgi:thioredoxin-like negative regulator of GroEL
MPRPERGRWTFFRVVVRNLPQFAAVADVVPRGPAAFEQPTATLHAKPVRLQAAATERPELLEAALEAYRTAWTMDSSRHPATIGAAAIHLDLGDARKALELSNGVRAEDHANRYAENVKLAAEAKLLPR